MERLRIAHLRLHRRLRPYPPNGPAQKRATTPGARRRPALCGLLLIGLAALMMGPRAETAAEPAGAPRPVLVMHIKGTIGVATSEFVTRALARARAAKARLLVIQLDTPGGLVSSMREIVSAMLASPVPVAVFVAPAGARAASAGTYMMYAAHVAAMAPGTHLGAATPITMSGPTAPRESEKKDGDKDGLSAGERKMVNDAVAYLRALAEVRRRNADWAERAVRAAATLTSTEARKENVIDLLASDLPDLLAKIDGRIVTAAGAERRLETKDAPVVEIEADWRLKIMAAIGDPTIAYLLLLIGVYGVLFEFLSPGAVAPGIIGGISLLLGLGALSVLPVDYAGLGLVALGIGLMTAEALTPGIGALGIGGLVAFVAGSLLLFDPDAARGIDFRVARPVIAVAALATALFFLFGLGLAWRARRRPVRSGREHMVGRPGEVVDWTVEGGTVRVEGEVWSARAAAPLQPGDPVRIVGVEGLTVVVEPASHARS
jgi:membrane-bound serine protease (ClpP class)